MATTTPLNGWPVPTSTDYVKDGASAIETLGDAIDTSVGSGLLAWQSWAPTLSGGWANGNGVYSDAKYVQLGKIVLARATFTVGSTTTKGSGLTVSLPVAQTGVAHTLISTNTAGGSAGRLLFNTVESGNGVLYAMDTANPYLVRAGITATVPQTWATNDIIRFNFIYQAA